MHCLIRVEWKQFLHFLLVVLFLDGSIVWGRGCPTSASDTSMSAWKYLIFSWNITEIAPKILKCQCLAIVETCLNHQFSSPMFPPFSTLWVFNQATCNLVLPAQNILDLPHRRSNNPRGLPGSVHYQLPAPANTSCTMRFLNTHNVGTLDPHKDVQRCTNSVCSQKNKDIYIYIKCPTHNYHLDFCCLCFWGFHFFFKNLILVAFLSSFSVQLQQQQRRNVASLLQGHRPARRSMLGMGESTNMSRAVCI